jgi:aconitate hydratase
VLALEFIDETDYDRIEQEDELAFRHLHQALRNEDKSIEVENKTKDETYALRHRMSPRQLDMVLKGGLIPVFQERLGK